MSIQERDSKCGESPIDGTATRAAAQEKPGRDGAKKRMAANAPLLIARCSAHQPPGRMEHAHRRAKTSGACPEGI